jgi:hypothetical protein
MGGDELCAKMEEQCEEENASEGGHGRTRDLINEYLGAGDDFCRQFNRTYEDEDMFGCIWLVTEKYTPIKPDPATNPDGTLNCPQIRQWCETYAGSASMKGNKVTVTPSRFICQLAIKQKYIGGCDIRVWDRVGGRTAADSTTTEELLLLESDVSSVTHLP